VQTEHVQSVVRCALRTQLTRFVSFIIERVPMPPGTTTMSGFGSSSSARSATILSMPLSVAIGPGSAATNVTFAPGRRLSVSYGPTASSAVKRSKSGMAMSMAAVPFRQRSGRGRRPG
jgi:hypothetical protein